MVYNNHINIEFIKQNGLILFEAISGSHAYGTNIATSDQDIRGVFVLPADALYGLSYIEQVSDDKNDTVYYELRRFLELVAVNNPNILELLNTPKDCILYKHPAFDLILEQSDTFITKQCKDSFAGYARKQISKAEGMNKMQNWEAKRVSRKTPLDFCYAIVNDKSRSIRSFLKKNKLDQKFCGLTKIPNSPGLYAMYYDLAAAKAFSNLYSEKDRLKQKSLLKKKGQMGLGYYGIEKELDIEPSLVKELKNGNPNNINIIQVPTVSHTLRCSSIPKGEKIICFISFNGNGYSTHCRDYAKYQEWKKKANRSRWTDVKKHGQQIDGKNMLHCRRLLDMAKEIAEGKGINVRRPNAKELLDIRKGKVKLRDLINKANDEIKQINTLFEKSNLADKLEEKFIHELLVKVRKEFYSTCEVEIHNGN